MTRDIEIEVSILEKSWDLHGLINTCKSDKILRDFFYSGNKRNSEFRELLWANTHGDVIGHDEYINLKGAKKKLFCEFYEWIGCSSEGKLQGLIQQWYRNGNKKFEGSYVDGKRHGDFIIFSESGEEEYCGVFENCDLLQTNYGF